MSITKDDINEMMGSPIRVKDLTSMMRRKISNNEKPYTASVLRSNNALVDEWEERVLLRTCNSKSEIPASRAERSLRVFLEGKFIVHFIKNRSMFPDPPLDTVLHYIDFFRKNDVREIQALGTVVVSLAWGMINTYVKNQLADRKWELVYSQSDDPKEWERLSGTHHSLFDLQNPELPLDLTSEDIRNIGEKVSPILTITIKPDNLILHFKK